MEKNNDIRIEAFLNKLESKGKTGIRFPYKEKYAEQRINFLGTLLKKGLISKGLFTKKVDEINSLSLDEEMYKEFVQLVSE